MGPTVIELDAVAVECAGAFGATVGIAVDVIVGRNWFGADGVGIVGAVKTSGASSQLAVTFLFMLGEM